MSRLSDALDNAEAAFKAASQVFLDDYPVGKDVIFVWTDGNYHPGTIIERSFKKFHVYVRSALDRKAYEVSAQRIIEGEKHVAEY